MKNIIAICVLLFISCKKDTVQYQELKLDSEIKILMHIYEATPGEIESISAEFTLPLYYYSDGSYTGKTISEKTPVITGSNGSYLFLAYGNTKGYVNWKITKKYKNGSFSTEEGKTALIQFYTGGHIEVAVPF